MSLYAPKKQCWEFPKYDKASEKTSPELARRYLSNDTVEDSVWYNMQKPVRVGPIRPSYVLLSIYCGIPQPIFDDKLKALILIGYVTKDGDLTPKGLAVAKELYGYRYKVFPLKCYPDCKCDNGLKNRSEVIKEYGTEMQFCPLCNYTYNGVGGVSKGIKPYKGRI